MTPLAKRRDLFNPEKVETAQPMTNRRRAVDYARVSSRSQDKMSLGTQHDENRGYARRSGLLIVRSFDDVGSGLSAENRQGFLKMVEFVLDKENSIGDIVFFDLDRFTRRNRDFYNFTETLEEGGIYLHSVAEGQVYSKDSALSWQIRTIVNEGTSRSTSFHTKRGQRGATRAGRYIGAKTPYGYEIPREADQKEDGEGEQQPPPPGHLQPYPEEWPHLLKIMEMGLNNHSPLNIARHLNRMGVPRPTGGPWAEDGVRYILQNPHYTGYTFRGLRPKSRLPGRPDELPPERSTVPAHEAAISIEDYKRLQRLIEARTINRGPTRSHNSPHLFSNKAKCGECKTPEGTHNLIVLRDHRYEPKLRCAKKKKQGTETCPKKMVPMLQFQELVFARFIGYILTEENLERQIEIGAHGSKEYLQKAQEQKGDLEKRRRVVEEQLRNANEAVLKYGTRYPNLASLMESINRLEKEKVAMTREIERIAEDSEEARRFVSDPEGIVATLLDVRTYMESGEEQAVRELIKTFIARLEVFNDRVDIYYHLTPSLEDIREDMVKDTINLRDNGHDRKKSCLLAGLMGIWMVLNRGAMAVSRLTSSQRARASWVSTNSAPEPAVAESMAALRLDCHPSNTRGLGPPGSRIWAASRLRTQARSRWSKPVYLP